MNVKANYIRFALSLSEIAFQLVDHLGVWIELNGNWVQALPGPMRLGLRTGALCSMFSTKLEVLCSFSKVPDGPYT